MRAAWLPHCTRVIGRWVMVREDRRLHEAALLLQHLGPRNGSLHPHENTHPDPIFDDQPVEDRSCLYRVFSASRSRTRGRRRQPQVSEWGVVFGDWPTRPPSSRSLLRSCTPYGSVDHHPSVWHLRVPISPRLIPSVVLYDSMLPTLIRWIMLAEEMIRMSRNVLQNNDHIIFREVPLAHKHHY